MTKVLGRALDRVEDTLAFLVGVMLLGLIFVIVYDVVARRFGLASAPWTVPLAEYYIVALTFLPAAWILRRNGHVAVDFLTGMLAPRRAAVLSFLTIGLSLAACCIAAWYSATLVLDDYQRGIPLSSGGLSVPRWLTRVSIPLGLVLLIAELVRVLAAALTTRTRS